VIGQLSVAEVNLRVLLAVGILIVVVRAIGSLIGMIGQPRVLGELLAGIILGPSLLGLLFPSALDYLFPAAVIDALHVLAQFGLVIFMFMVGLEFDPALMRGQGATVAVVSQVSFAVPLVLAIGLAAWTYPAFGAGVDRLAFCLFMGAAMSVTAFPVLARLLQESDLMRTRIGTVSLVCAAFNDLAAWSVLAVVVAIAKSAGLGGAITTVLLAVGYVLAMLVIVRPLLARRGDLRIWFVLVTAVLSAWTTEQIGIHAIVGSFLAGVVMPRLPEWRRWVQRRLEVVVSNLLLPIFFVIAGLSTRVDQLTAAGLGLLVIVVAVAVVGKFGGSMLAARLAGEDWRNASTLGVLMNTRGITEIIILHIGLDLGILTPTVFTVMVLMALITTLMAAPLLQLIKRRSHMASPADE
jgi:Kef-type K+ transport system membrane component KefB